MIKVDVEQDNCQAVSRIVDEKDHGIDGRRGVQMGRGGAKSGVDDTVLVGVWGEADTL